jgi:hypothetical protein
MLGIALRVPGAEYPSAAAGDMRDGSLPDQRTQEGSQP